MNGKLFACAMACVTALAAFADLGEPLAATQDDYVFAFDTETAQPYVVANLETATPLPYSPFQTVKATPPGGTASTIVVAGASGGTNYWTPDVGGVWTLENSVEGRATFSARHSLFGTQGTGTAADPLKIVDVDELADLIQSGTAADGSVFVTDPLLSTATVVLPDGWAVSREAQKWVLAESSDGLVFDGPGAMFCFDSRRPGPDRRIRAKDALPIAYSGDGWGGDEDAASQLTLVPPGGEASELQFKGTGAYPFLFSQEGLWRVSLVANGKTDDAYVYIAPDGFLLIFR